MPCENAAQSNDYFEFIGEYSGVLDYVKEEFNTECITVIDQRFAIAYVKKERTDIHIWTKIIHIIRFHVVSV